MILLSAFRGEGGASGNLFRRPILHDEGAGFSLPRAFPRMRHSRGGVNEAKSIFHRSIVVGACIGSEDIGVHC